MSIKKYYEILSEAPEGWIDPTHQGGGTGTVSVKQGQMAGGRKPDVKGEPKLGQAEPGKWVYDKVNTWLKSRSQYDALKSLDGKTIAKLLLSGLPAPSRNITHTPYEDDNAKISWSLNDQGQLELYFKITATEEIGKMAPQVLEYNYKAPMLLRLGSEKGFDRFANAFIADTMRQIEKTIKSLEYLLSFKQGAEEFLSNPIGSLADLMSGDDDSRQPGATAADEEEAELPFDVEDIKSQVSSAIKDTLAENKEDIISAAQEAFEGFRTLVLKHPAIIYGAFFLKSETDKETGVGMLGEIEDWLNTEIILDTVLEHAEEAIEDVMKGKISSSLAEAFSLIPVRISDEIKIYAHLQETAKEIRPRLSKNSIWISKTRIKEIIREEIAKTFGGTHPDETYTLGTKKSLMLDIPTQHGGWPEGEYDPPVNKRIYDYLKSMGMVQ